MHFDRLRPRDGYCLLDFYEVWLWQAIRRGDADDAYRWARELTHWARKMCKELREEDR